VLVTDSEESSGKNLLGRIFWEESSGKNLLGRIFWEESSGKEKG
jgi:hypothetical protein